MDEIETLFSAIESGGRVERLADERMPRPREMNTSERTSRHKRRG
jgi:hypothetical protein